MLDSSERPDSVGLGVVGSGQAWATHSGPLSLVGQQASLGDGYGPASIESAHADGTVSFTTAAPRAEPWLILRLPAGGNYRRFG